MTPPTCQVVTQWPPHRASDEPSLGEKSMGMIFPNKIVLKSTDGETRMCADEPMTGTVMLMVTPMVLNMLTI